MTTARKLHLTTAWPPPNLLPTDHSPSFQPAPASSRSSSAWRKAQHRRSTRSLGRRSLVPSLNDRLRATQRKIENRRVMKKGVGVERERGREVWVSEFRLRRSGTQSTKFWHVSRRRTGSQMSKVLFYAGPTYRSPRPPPPPLRLLYPSAVAATLRIMPFLLSSPGYFFNVIQTGNSQNMTSGQTFQDASLR